MILSYFSASPLSCLEWKGWKRMGARDSQPGEGQGPDWAVLAKEKEGLGNRT